MLVLTRKQGEGITIGDEIKISVVEIKGKQVRLGIEAPPEIIIYRDEVLEKLVEQSRLAANADGESPDE